MGTFFKWTEENKPLWWPNALPFESPRKANIGTLDTILNTFVKFQVYTNMVSTFFA